MDKTEPVIISEDDLKTIKRLESIATIYAHVVNKFWDELEPAMSGELTDDLTRMFFAAMIEETAQ